MGKLRTPLPTLEKAAFLMLQGKRVSEIAEELHTSRAQINSWQRHQQFREILASAHGVHLDRAKGYAAQRALKIVKALEDICLDAEQKATDRVLAGKAVLEYADIVQIVQHNTQNNIYPQAPSPKMQTAYSKLLEGKTDEQTIEAESETESDV